MLLNNMFKNCPSLDSISNENTGIALSNRIRSLFRVLLPIFLLIGLTALPVRLLAQDQIVLQSSLIPAPDTVWVFTPSDYEDNRDSYPAVYLLHGYAGSYHQWNDIIDLQKLANHFGFVIVCPDGFYNSWYLNSPVKENHQYESFFFKNLIPEINEQYRVDKQQIFITGLSMGGHGALYLFSQHPELFRSAGSISGVVNLVAVDTAYGLGELLGSWETHRQRWKKFSVIENLKSIKKSGKMIIFDVGRDDPFFKMNKKLSRKADSLGIDATFIIRAGGHTYDYWKKSIPYHFFFFEKLLDKKKSDR